MRSRRSVSGGYSDGGLRGAYQARDEVAAGELGGREARGEDLRRDGVGAAGQEEGLRARVHCGER